MSASLKDIAKKLDISTTTVSWVLSNQGTQKRISKATQAKIWQCAREMNYRPNLLARGLNTGSTGTIGLILPSISDSFYSQVAKAIELKAEEYGYTLMIGSTESEVERENRMIQMFKAKQIDGLIIAPTKYSRVEIEQLVAESYPFVLFDRYFEDIDTNYILINNEECSHDLVEGLIKDGRKKIAILLTNPHLKIMDMRYDGYKRAMQEAGLELSPDLYGVVEFANFEENIGEVLDRMFNKVPDIDGIFFATHVLAMDTFCHCHDKHIDIKRLGLACIHEVSSFRLLAPTIKIARMPVQEIGKNTVRILHQNIVSKRNLEEFQTESLILRCEIPG